MTPSEIIALYREQDRQTLLAAWQRLAETSFRGVREVRNFDPYLWSLDHARVKTEAGKREALALWCHEHCAGRWMFNELPTGDLFLFERGEDVERFRAALAAEAVE
jgi:hypothetical protein